MRKGRPPKPTTLKLLEGNPGKRKLNMDTEPKGTEVDSEKVALPSWVDGVGRCFFRRCWINAGKIKVLTEEDRDALIHVAMEYSLYRKAHDYCKRNGLSYQTSTATGEKIHKPYPEAAQSIALFKNVRSGLADFGLTPSGRVGMIKTPNKDKPENPLARYQKKNS